VPEPSIQKDFVKMLDQGVFSDITFVVGEQKFKAHKCIIATRCTVFASMLSAEMRESVESIITV
jgi:hypothetical protein